MESFESDFERYDDTESPKRLTPREVQTKIKWLEDCIKNAEKRIATVEEHFSEFSKEEIEFFRLQEIKALEEFKRRKYNLEHGLDEFTGEKIPSYVDPGNVDLYTDPGRVDLYTDGDSDYGYSDDLMKPKPNYGGASVHYRYVYADADYYVPETGDLIIREGDIISEEELVRAKKKFTTTKPAKKI